MGFRLVPKSVTLNDLERCNGHYLHNGCAVLFAVAELLVVVDRGMPVFNTVARADSRNSGL